MLQRGLTERRSLKRKVDEMTSSVLQTHPALPRFINTRTSIVPYFNGSESAPYFRVRFAYVADDWLFVESIHIKTDTRTYDLFPEQYGRNSIERDNGGGGIWEWWDVPGDEHFPMLVDIGNSAKVMVRFEGRQYIRDWTMPAADRRAIKAMADVRYSYYPRPSL